MTNSISTFMKLWEEKTKEYYTNVRETLLNNNLICKEILTDKGLRYTSIYRDFNPAYGYAWDYLSTILSEEEIQVCKDSYNFYMNLPTTTRTLATYDFSRIDEILKKEAIKKEKQFISRVEKKIGVIEDTTNLRLGADSSLNGIVHGSKGSAEVTTILAWGAIIKPHYRVLVK